MRTPFELRLRPDWRWALGAAALAWLPICLTREPRVHVRYLLVLPYLLAFEGWMTGRLAAMPKAFLERNLVRKEDRARFEAAVEGARVRNWVTELILLVLACLATLRQGGTPWESFVSLPLFRFVLWRWLARLALWYQFVWRVSRLKLAVNAAHPDSAGGLAFLYASVDAFRPILFALSAMIVGRVLWMGTGLLSVRVQALAVLFTAGGVILLPQLAFLPMLDEAKRRGRRVYGIFSARYIQDFERKALENPPEDLSTLSEDLQGMDSAGAIYAGVRGMRLIPVTRESLLRMAAAAALPLFPVLVYEVGLSNLGKIGRLLSELLFGSPFSLP